MRKPALSICINTRNRAALLAETLDSIVGQMIPGIEIVVVDGASKDNTPEVMRRYSSEYPFVRYMRSEKDLGIDDGYDAAVGCAAGDYCWFMTDDDLVVPGALELILARINPEYDLIVLNMDCFTKDLSLDLNQRFFKFYEDKVYRQDNFEIFLSELGYGLAYIGCVIIKRSLWFEKDRTPFIGTFFVHVGVILGSSLIRNVLFLHDPLIQYRSANSSWTARSFDIWYFKWPNLVWSFSKFSAAAKNKMAIQRPWKRALTLIKSRAMGEYNSKIFEDYLSAEESQWVRLYSYAISKIPITPLSLLLILLCLLFRRDGLYTVYCLMVSSPHPALSNKLIQLFGLKFPYAPVNA